MRQGPAIGVTQRIVSATRVSRWLAARIVLVLAICVLAFKPLLASAAQPPVGLGTAASFAVLAGTGITNTGVTTISGNVGTYPTGSETGMTACPGADCVTLTGTNHGNDPVSQGAQSDLTIAYVSAAGRTPATDLGVTDLGGLTLTPGVYTNSGAGTFTITTGRTLTLNAQGNPNGVFIFKSASTIDAATGSTVRLIGAAQPCNVFWQVTSSATLNTGATFVGTIMALTSITVADSVTVNGRLLARNGDVTLIHDTITRSVCAAPTGTATTPPPSGGVQTGGGSTAGIQDVGLLVFGGALLAASAGAFALRRRVMRKA